MTERTKIALLCAFVLCTASACKDETDSPGSTIDAGNTTDAGIGAPADTGLVVDAGAPDCYTAPKSYVELINACTDAEKVVKNPTLPLLGPDGGLPPLP